MSVGERRVTVSHDRFFAFQREGAGEEMVASTVKWSASTDPEGDDFAEIEIGVEFPLDRSMTYEALEAEALSRACRAIQELSAETPEGLARKLKATNEQ